MKLRNVKEGETMPYVLWVLDGDDRQWKMFKGINNAKKFIVDNDYDELLDGLNTRIYPNGTYYNNYIDWVVIPSGEHPKSFDTHKFYNSIKTESKKRSVKESYSDIWSDNVWDAYDIAMEYLGAEGLCEALAKAMGTDALADNLKYIFRVNEIPFEEDEEEFDEGLNRFVESDNDYDWRNWKEKYKKLTVDGETRKYTGYYKKLGDSIWSVVPTVYKNGELGYDIYKNGDKIESGFEVFYDAVSAAVEIYNKYYKDEEELSESFNDDDKYEEAQNYIDNGMTTWREIFQDCLEISRTDKELYQSMIDQYGSITEYAKAIYSAVQDILEK